METCALEMITSDNHTLSVSNALENTVFPECKVVLVSSAATVGEHLASPGLRVVSKPSLVTVTCSPVHRSEAVHGRRQLCNTQEEPENIRALPHQATHISLHYQEVFLNKQSDLKSYPSPLN